ncbi:hypothetical protein BVC80_521g75 [Macleaya cordata]|uniref:Uncharacterized protein n=1 Tax=Macleaya cordata TaxID=56857 RepID=A0A200R9E5_MACCD|nr:hypothetical protein BVC80_521g75 [Macleaya cordata]
MEQPATPNTPPPSNQNGLPSTNSKKKIPTPQELISHYESQGLEKNEASMKVIEDLQNVLYRVLSSRAGKKEKFMAKTSRMLDTANTRLAILELKLDSKPGYGETLAIGVAAGGIVEGAGSVLPHVFGAIGQIWNSVRNSTTK